MNLTNDEKLINQGIKLGIKFAVEEFLGILPCNVKADVLNKTIDFLLYKFHSLDSTNE